MWIKELLFTHAGDFAVLLPLYEMYDDDVFVQRRGSYISVEDFMVNLDKETVECFHQFFNGSTSSRVLDSWIHQPGYPVIKVEVFRDRSPNVILLKQVKILYLDEIIIIQKTVSSNLAYS